jgi:murein DD-endopeptidase MepM/ murein hydrolase activator NlpD
LPDQRRPSRRLTDSHLLSRTVAHFAVLGLVAFASAFGISHAAAQPNAANPPRGLSIISAARGAAADAPGLRSATFELQPQGGDDGPDLEVSRASLPRITEVPLPTPVPVDPNATPLPAPPGVAVGQIQAGGSSSALGSTRVVAPSGGQLAWPVPGGTISQYYHAGHLALDIAAPYNSTVVAAEAGIVTSSGWRNNGGGLVISIDHGNGIVTVYNHLNALWVSAGQAVARGQGIAAVGCTGMCTGPHVHFETIVNGIIDNPLRYL